VIQTRHERSKCLYYNSFNGALIFTAPLEYTNRNASQAKIFPKSRSQKPKFRIVKLSLPTHENYKCWRSSLHLRHVPHFRSVAFSSFWVPTHDLHIVGTSVNYSIIISPFLLRPRTHNIHSCVQSKYTFDIMCIAFGLGRKN